MHKGFILFSKVPSAKTLTPVFGDKAKEARALLRGDVLDTDYEVARKMVLDCYHFPSWLERVMEVLNELAETHGVEALKRHTDDPQPAFLYLNTGDTYAPTLIVNCEKLTVYVSSYGDVVERNRL